jgi:hypothetical protein
MSEAEETRPYRYEETALIILDDTSFEEWSEMWVGLQATERGINFWIGDALNFGQRFGEEHSQVLDGFSFERQASTMRVATKFPPPRRRKNISWSVHREIAGLDDPSDQDRFLDLAAEQRLGAREIRALVQQHKVDHKRGAYPRNEPGNGFSPNDSTVESAEVSTETSTSEVAPDKPLTNGPETEPPQDRAERIRELIATLRSRGEQYPGAATEAAEMSSCVGEITGFRSHLERCAVDAIQALSGIPDSWAVHKIDAPAVEPGDSVRTWTVDLRKGRTHMAIGQSTWLPAAVLEAALSALLSEEGIG